MSSITVNQWVVTYSVVQASETVAVSHSETCSVYGCPIQLYPNHTEGRPGEYSSGDERVVVKDILLVVGNGTCPPVEHMEGGGGRDGQIYNFNGSASSLDHTHSNSSNEHIHHVCEGGGEGTCMYTDNTSASTFPDWR